MSIDELYERVTEAILHAEHLEEQGAIAQMRKAFLDVSRIEEEIAKAMPASGPEGTVARRGAVRAALKGGDPLYASWLADRYLAEPVHSALADELRRMKADAEALLDELRRMKADAEALRADPALAAVRVVPKARYHLHDAAA